MARRSSVASILLACALASGCVRAPAPLDVNAMVREHGADQARAQLEIRVLDDPRDVQARLALAKLADEAKRPGQAIEQLEAVIALGGPIGTRWHADDRARMARLLAQRGRVRLARGAATALDDLKRARSFGAEVTADELGRGNAAIALAQLRHVDVQERANGQRALAGLAGAGFADPSWLGAKPAPVPRDRGLFGIWLWEQGARRAAWEALDDWRATTSVKGGPIQDFYLRAFAWWHPLDARPPADADRIGTERCRFAGASCDPVAAIAGSSGERAALAGAPLPSTRTTDPTIATAWLALTLPQALSGEVAWGAAIAARVEVAAIELAAVPLYAREAFARLTGRSAIGVDDAALDELRPPERLVVAAGRVLDGATAAHVRIALGDLAATIEGVALLAMVAPPHEAAQGQPLDAALAAYVGARSGTRVFVGPVVEAYRRDPAIADRLARTIVMQADDAAAAHSALGALFEALADPGRARTAWEAAAALSPEPAFLRGLARAAARSGDPDAALIHATTAAAAAGDPATVWIELARALEGVGEHVHALEAARSAIDLAGLDTLPAALDVAVAASNALGRSEQATGFQRRRAQLGPSLTAPASSDPGRAALDPTDAVSALAALQAAPSVSAFARLWVASRWSPRNVAARVALLAAIPANDPLRPVLISELVALAADPDPVVGRAAVAALR